MKMMKFNSQQEMGSSCFSGTKCNFLLEWRNSTVSKCLLLFVLSQVAKICDEQVPFSMAVCKRANMFGSNMELKIFLLLAGMFHLCALNLDAYPKGEEREFRGGKHRVLCYRLGW